MKRVSVPTKQMGKFAGQWVVIDPMRDRIVAVGESLEEVGSLVTRSVEDTRPVGTVPFVHKVPRSDEGPYILWII
jgi:hypothetical protein